MRAPKPLWLGATLALLVGASGFVRLPLPLGPVRAALDERQPGFGVEGRAWIRWARGEVGAEDLRLSWQGEPLARVGTVAVDLDLRPWSERPGLPWRVRLRDGELELDRRRLDALLGLRKEPTASVSIEVEAGELRAAWTADDGARFAGRVVAARAIVRTGAALEAESAVEAELELAQPAAARASLRLRVVEGAEPEASLRATSADLMPLARMLPGCGELTGAASGELFLHHGPGSTRVRAGLDARELAHAALPARWERLELEASGDLTRFADARLVARGATGVIEADAHAERAPQPPGWPGAWNAGVQARLDGCAWDAELRAWFDRRIPAAAPVLDALGLGGVARARAGLRARIGPDGLADGWSLAAAAPVDGLSMRFAGFADASGERFAFPYPMAFRSGVAGWDGRAVLVAAEGVAGEAEGDPHGGVGSSTHVTADCAVDLGVEGAAVWLDLSARDVRLDARLDEAMRPNAELYDLWRRLGDPRGAADVEVLLRPAPGGAVQWRVRAESGGLEALPPDAGIALRASGLRVEVDAHGARFAGAVSTAAAAAELRGEALAAADPQAPWELALDLRGRGSLDAAERAVLAKSFPLPAAFVECEPGTDPVWSCAGRLDLAKDVPPPAGIATLELRDAAPAWPQRSLTGAGWQARADCAAAGGRTLLALAPAAGSWKDAQLRLGGALLFEPGAESPRGTLTGAMRESAIRPDEVAAALDLIGASEWAAGLRFAGRTAAVVELPLDDPAAARARLDLNPLQVVVQPGAFGPTAASEPMRYQLTGALRYRDGSVSTPRLGLRGNQLDLVLEQASGRLDGEGLRLAGAAVSARGVQLREHAAVVAPPRVLASFDRIGLDGRVAPKRLEFEVEWPAGGVPRASASGTLVLSDFALDGPPTVRGGAGEVLCEQFLWNGPEDFRGRFLLDAGEAEVSGVGVHGASAEIALFPDRLVVTGFEATALDGRVFTDIPLPDGGVHEGSFALGLAGAAAVRADFGFDGFLLERMGEELGYRGPLAGRLDGRVDVRSSDPSPLNYRGTAEFQITDGVLGAVPVLSQIWQLLGVEAPVFREGRLAMQFLSEGRVLVDELTLLHPLLEITGKRMISMDTYLGLKMTVRTFGLLGRLPLISHLMDLIVEQDVYGPASAPRLRQRGLGKLFQGDPERVPFPLWAPRTPQPDRRRSPLLPNGPVLAPRE